MILAIIILLFILIILKLFEMIQNLIWLIRNGSAYEKEIKPLISKWANEKFDISEFNEILRKHKRKWLPEDWPIRRIMLRLPTIFRNLLIQFLFRLSILFVFLITVLLVSNNHFVLIVGSVLLFLIVWIEVLYSVLHRLTFGYCDNYFIKTLSLLKFPHPPPQLDYIVPTRTQLVRDFSIHFGNLLAMIIIGYTTIYHSLTIVLSTQPVFTNISSGIVGVLDLLYFTIITLATVGYGDISPGTQTIVRLTVSSQVLASFVLIVFLLTSFTLTTDPDK